MIVVAGSATCLIGAVGDDGFGASMRSGLDGEGIATGSLQRPADCGREFLIPPHGFPGATDY